MAVGPDATTVRFESVVMGDAHTRAVFAAVGGYFVQLVMYTGAFGLLWTFEPRGVRPVIVSLYALTLLLAVVLALVGFVGMLAAERLDALRVELREDVMMLTGDFSLNGMPASGFFVIPRSDARMGREGPTTVELLVDGVGHIVLGQHWKYSADPPSAWQAIADHISPAGRHGGTATTGAIDYAHDPSPVVRVSLSATAFRLAIDPPQFAGHSGRAIRRRWPGIALFVDLIGAAVPRKGGGAPKVQLSDFLPAAELLVTSRELWIVRRHDIGRQRFERVALDRVELREQPLGVFVRTSGRYAVPLELPGGREADRLVVDALREVLVPAAGRTPAAAP